MTEVQAQRSRADGSPTDFSGGSLRGPGILERIVAGKRAEVARLRAKRRDLARAADDEPPPRRVLEPWRERREVAVIAEVKRRSPGAGAIDPGLDPLRLSAEYEAGGACAISVLTDAAWFGGSLDDLRVLREARDVPVLRKDFVIDEVQVIEARAAGADLVLLIVRILEPALLGDLRAMVHDMGMTALVEVHDEWEVEAALEAGFRGRGANGPAFATIVAAGVNACTLHYSANSARICADDLVLVDAGAEFDFYAADITRTVPASGRLAGVRREVYEVVLDAHRAAVAASVPGGTLEGVHGAAARRMAEGLVAAGILEGTVEEVLDERSHRRFFPHRTSHWLGLDTHDAGPYHDLGGPATLEPGMVFTVEPGLYFPPGSSPGRPGLEGTGIRLEDDVLVTPEGAEVLTAALPLEPDALREPVGR